MKYPKRVISSDCFRRQIWDINAYNYSNSDRFCYTGGSGWELALV